MNGAVERFRHGCIGLAETGDNYGNQVIGFVEPFNAYSTVYITYIIGKRCFYRQNTMNIDVCRIHAGMPRFPIHRRPRPLTLSLYLPGTKFNVWPRSPPLLHDQRRHPDPTRFFPLAPATPRKIPRTKINFRVCTAFARYTPPHAPQRFMPFTTYLYRQHPLNSPKRRLNASMVCQRPIAS